MQNAAIETATNAGIKIAHIAQEVNKAKALVEDAVETRKRQAQRMFKRGYAAAEETLEDTAYYIKRHPWQSIGLAAGVGAGIVALSGLLASWMFVKARKVAHSTTED